mgnify:CR=1 FL=1
MTRDQALAVLNLPETATAQEVQQAYERLVRRYPPEFHPDKFCQIDAAHRFLTSLPYRLERLFAPEKFQADRQGGLTHTLEPPAFDGEALLAAWHQQLLRVDEEQTHVATPDEARWQLVVQAVQSMPPDQATQWLVQASQLGMLPNSVPATPAQPPVAAEAPSAAPAPPPAETAAAEPVAAAEKYPSIYPNAAMALHDGANTGRLAPGGEHWYSFIRQDFDDELFEHMAITMFATPTDGNTSHHINFQLYPASQIHMWLRGTPKAMVPMGEGEWVSRDNDPVTGERLWSGTVVDGDTYYLRVFNNSDAVIDYYLINQDVINTELGDRVFAANRYYPYVLYPAGSAVATRNR